MATQKQFNDFLSDIEPSKTTKENSRIRHSEVRDFLATDVQFGPTHIKTFLSGSYKRNTAIRPVTSMGVETRPDVDIIVVTNHSLDDDPREVIDNLFEPLARLKNSRVAYTKIRRQSRSIGLFTSNVDMDVVPIIAPNGLDSTLYIPNRKYETQADKWLVTNPPGHTDWTIKMNAISEGRFKPLVKLMKWWRRENPTISKRPKGFMIECIVAECFDKNQSNYQELFLGTLDAIVYRFESDIYAKRVPFISDPGVPFNDVMSSVSFDSFEGFYNKVKRHAEIGRLIRSEKDPKQEFEHWTKIFGTRFPKSSAAQFQSTLKSAESVSPYSFPNKPITPKKPRGFA